MNMERRDDQPGLWVNTEWNAGSPGMFAVLIGVSRYAHLVDCQPPSAMAPNTYGLGQLKVSALTAWRMFEWLTTEYDVQDCPLAKCWLLLSPTDKELDHAPEMASCQTEASFGNCKSAIEHWYAEMKSLAQASAENSRALFFFSGHGLEMTAEKQILLPEDYLRPPTHPWNEAISTRNLRDGLASLAVPRQFFFIDACRNDHHDLRAKNVTGTEILPEDEAAAVNPALVAPVLYATASGHQAFQQPKPSKGLSIFGQSLLDGLKGRPDIELKQADNSWSVNMYPLEGFVKERVVQYLNEAGASVIQPVKFGGTQVANEEITFLTQRQAIVSRIAGGQPAIGDRADDLIAAGVPTSLDRGMRVTKMMVDTFTDSEVVAEPQTWSTDFNIGHKLFGSEYVTEIFSNRLRLVSLSTGEPVDREILQLHHVQRHETQLYRAEFSLAEFDHVGYWLELNDLAEVSHGCVLPAGGIDGEADRPIRYSLMVQADIDDADQRRIIRMDAGLSPENIEMLAEAAEIWERYQTADMNVAVEAYEAGQLQTMVRRKLMFPLAATIASLVLLRANRLDLLYDWLSNLTRLFEQRPDGPALWAEQNYRTRSEENEALHVSVEFVVKLLDRGLPHTSEAWSYASALVDRLLKQQKRLSESEIESLQGLGSLFRETIPYYRPGGLFTSYSGFQPGQIPKGVIPPR